MVRFTSTLTASTTPALHALEAVVLRIAERDGPEKAAEWARKAIAANPELFVQVSASSAPELRVIDGGKT